MQTTALSGTDVRIIFRVGFTVLFALINLLGSQCQTLNIKFSLLQNAVIPVPIASGWLTGASILQPLRHLRRIPNPLWWSVMATVALLAFASDLATSAIRLQPVHTFCDFGQGMVLNLDGQDSFSVPPANGRPAIVAGNAQLFSLNNSCSIGIFRKANTDSRFCATSSDLLGSWSCQDVQEDVAYEFGSITWEDVAADLASRGLQYANWSAAPTTTSDGLLWDHLVVLSSSQSDDARQPFDVKASVDLTSTSKTDQIMKSFQCTMNAQPAEAIASGIPSAYALYVWVSYSQGQLYYGAGAPPVDNIPGTLEWLLNSIIMVAGSSNYLLGEPPANESQQGCVNLVTYIPNWLVALAGLVVLIFVVSALTAAGLWMRVRAHKNAAQVEHAPTNQWEWMAQACAESNAGEAGPEHAVEKSRLKDYEIVLGVGNAVRIQRAAEELQGLRSRGL